MSEELVLVVAPNHTLANRQSVMSIMRRTSPSSPLFVMIYVIIHEVGENYYSIRYIFVLASPFYHQQTYYLVIVEKLTLHGDANYFVE